MSNNTADLFAEFGITPNGKRGRKPGQADAKYREAIEAASKGGKTIGGRKTFPVMASDLGVSMTTARKAIRSYVNDTGADVQYGKDGAIIALPKPEPKGTGRKAK